MAGRRNIFATAFMQTGRFLSHWRGWVQDWRRMCYLWEHLDGDNGISIRWNPDGSATIDGALVQGGGGGGGSGITVTGNDSGQTSVSNVTSLKFASASDSNVKVTITAGQNAGEAIATIGVYYVP